MNAFSNSKYQYSENQKTPEKYTGGPDGWKNMGPLPHIFPLAALAALDPILSFLRVFCLIAILHCVKKEDIKEKNGQIVIDITACCPGGPTI